MYQGGDSQEHKVLPQLLTNDISNFITIINLYSRPKSCIDKKTDFNSEFCDNITRVSYCPYVIDYAKIKLINKSVLFLLTVGSTG